MMMHERISEVIKDLGMNPKRFAEKILNEKSPTKVYAWLKDPRKVINPKEAYSPNTAALQKMENNIPGLNPAWLRTGEGDKYLSKEVTKALPTEKATPSAAEKIPSTPVLELMAELRELKEELFRLKNIEPELEQERLKVKHLTAQLEREREMVDYIRDAYNRGEQEVNDEISGALFNKSDQANAQLAWFLAKGVRGSDN